MHLVVVDMRLPSRRIDVEAGEQNVFKSILAPEWPRISVSNTSPLAEKRALRLGKVTGDSELSGLVVGFWQARPGRI